MAAGKKIALVTCSTRAPRLNPYITRYVHDRIAPLLPGVTIDTVDLADQKLPLYDEPALNAIPAGLISQTLIPGVAVIDPSIVELAPAVITRLTIVHPPAQPV